MKRVMDDFVGAMVCLFVVAQSKISLSASFSVLVSVVASVEMSGKVSAIVTSSA